MSAWSKTSRSQNFSTDITFSQIWHLGFLMHSFLTPSENPESCSTSIRRFPLPAQGFYDFCFGRFLWLCSTASLYSKRKLVWELILLCYVKWHCPLPQRKYQKFYIMHCKQTCYWDGCFPNNHFTFVRRSEEFMSFSGSPGISFSCTLRLQL